MAHRAQSCDDSVIDALLHEDLLGRLEWWGTNAKSWNVHRALWIHPEDEEVQEVLHLALWLHESAHVRESAVELPIPQAHGRNQGVVRPLSAHQLIGVALWGQDKACPTVLQCKSAPLRNDTGPKAAEHRVLPH